MGGGEKKKKIKKKKEMGSGEWGLRVWWEKRGSEKERRKKIWKWNNKISFICMLILFGAKRRIVKIYIEDVYDIFLS